MQIIFDTDMGSDCDDVGALALLHAYADMRKVDLLGCIYSSGKIRYGAGVIDAINTYYGRGDIPIGAAYDTLVGDPVDKMDAKTLAMDVAQFGHDIITSEDAIEQASMLRSLLVNQPDTSVVYITVGHTKGIYDLLRSGADSISDLTGTELIRTKVKKWIALGALRAADGSGNLRKDWNFFFNGTAPYTDYLIEHFPRPIYFVDGGHKVMTGKSLAATPPGNIVREAYATWLANYENKTLEDQRPSWDLVTVYFAVEGLGDFFELALPGRLSFDAENGCRWETDSVDSRHNYVRQLPDTDEQFAKYLNEMISRGPNESIPLALNSSLRLSACIHPTQKSVNFTI